MNVLILFQFMYIYAITFCQFGHISLIVGFNINSFTMLCSLLFKAICKQESYSFCRNTHFTQQFPRNQFPFMMFHYDPYIDVGSRIALYIVNFDFYEIQYDQSIGLKIRMRFAVYYVSNNLVG